MSLTRRVVLALSLGASCSSLAVAQDTPPVPSEAPAPAEVKVDSATPPVEEVPAGPTLKVGDAAPALKIAKWVKGTEVKGFETGKAYVVEFWATWCGPCKKTIPHLTKLAKENKDVTFIGVSVWEKAPDEPGTEYIEKVEKFVTGMGEKMEYVVAADTGEGDMAKSWMEASQAQGIPTAFVVGKDSKIAWIGHPSDGMDEVVKAVQAGTFDAAKESARREADAKKQAELEEKVQSAMGLHSEGKSTEALAAMDTIISGVTDEEIKLQLQMMKFNILTAADVKEAVVLARTLATGPGKDNPQLLYMLATRMQNDPAFNPPDHALITEMLTSAVAAHRVENGEDHPALLSPLAQAQFAKGDIDGAIASQEKALQLIKDTGSSAVAEFQAKLDEYKAAKK